MSKRYILTLKNGLMEDWGADHIGFSPTHVLFMDKAGELTHAIHAENVREIEVQEEG